MMFIFQITPFYLFFCSLLSWLPSSTLFPYTTLFRSLETPITKSSGPFFLNTLDNSIAFPLHRDQFIPISEVMVHYLLLYNLSMLSRYETEWWGELITTMSSIDYPFIVHFLHNSSRKIPLLLGDEMYQEHFKN